jgi:hypothetical protein
VVFVEPPATGDEIGAGSSESRLDVLLAEELATDPSFVQWFLHEAGQWRERREITRRATSAWVRLNVYEDGTDLPLDAHGESDVELILQCGDVAVPVLIEDKVWAPFQDRQPERYVGRAEARGGLAVLVAPADYIKGVQPKAALFHGSVTVEEIVGRLKAMAEGDVPDVSRRRHTWRAQLLGELIKRPTPPEDHPPTVAFTEHCTAWFRSHGGLVVVPRASSLRTWGQGWLDFESPKGLLYKATGWAKVPTAGVDLYVKDHGFAGTAKELGDLLAGRLPEGFRVTTDTAKVPNVVLRFDCHKVDPDGGPPAPGSDREAFLLEALGACQRVAEWLLAHKGLLERGS